MSSTPRVLEAAPEDREVVRLRREIVGLEGELEAAKKEAQQVKQASADAIAAVRALRKTTEPLYTALRMIHGEISRIDVSALGDQTEQATVTIVSTGIWAERIAKSGAEGKVLQALLDGGGPMSLSQLRVAAHTGSNTSTYLKRLFAKNWVQKMGHGSWALK